MCVVSKNWELSAEEIREEEEVVCMHALHGDPQPRAYQASTCACEVALLKVFVTREEPLSFSPIAGNRNGRTELRFRAVITPVWENLTEAIVTSPSMLQPWC